jgi:RNA polymerase sigma-70 factor (ECF subfamily)
MGYLRKYNPLKSDQKQTSMVVERIKGGDKTQLESIYKAYKFEFIAWITRNYSCTEEEAKDVYQFAILTFYDNINKGRLVELQSSIKTYLFAIGKNKILEYKKVASRFQSKDENEIADIPEIDNWDTDLREKNLSLVERCLEKLGDPCKSLLQLYYYHGMSMDDITDKMEYKNRLTTKNLKYKCINRLRKIYLEELKKMGETKL